MTSTSIDNTGGSDSAGCADYTSKAEKIGNIEDINNKKFDTFLFDLDGTLLNTLPDLVLLTNGILEDQGYPTRTQEEILSFVGNGVRRLMYLALPEGVSEEEADHAMDLWNSRFHDYYHNTHPYPKMIETLQELRDSGCKIGAVSNKLQTGVDLILDICMPGFMQVSFGEGGQDSQGRTMPRKPDPTGLFMAMDELGSTPESTVYVGDSPGDILAARNAGISAIGVSWGYHEPQDFAEARAEPDMIIDSPSELLALAR